MGSTLQTLDRGIQALEVVAGRAGGLSVAELAVELGVARAVCHRVVGTLVAHGLVARDDDGRLHLGARLPVLASGYWPGVLSRAPGLLQPLADRTRATSFLAVVEDEQAVVLVSLDPTDALLRVGYRVGSRHPLTRGASGLAVLAA
uniref:IclR family transcriptional regulator n=1 Tax=Desertihabitans aurantiacus TaxID=2282477 RepID=UPI000DF732C0